MAEKILSISIAAYNVEQYLENTVTSVTSSKVVDDVEIIIVNDGSKDSTKNIAHELYNIWPGSIVVIDKKNGGYGSTINASKRIAKGKYFKLLDGDDWFQTESLDDFITFLRECEADIVVSPYYRVTNEKVNYDKHPEIISKAVGFDEITLDNYCFVMHEIAVKTEVLKKCNSEITENCFYTDVEFLCNALTEAETIARFDRPVYCYRLGEEGQSVSLTGLRKHHEDHPIVTKKVFSNYEKSTNRIHGEKKKAIDYWVTSLTRNTFISYLVMDKSSRYRRELIAFDQDIKAHYPVQYQIGNNSKFVHNARRTFFRPYMFWHKAAISTISK